MCAHAHEQLQGRRNPNGYEEIEREEIVERQIVNEQVVVRWRFQRAYGGEEVFEQQVVKPRFERTHGSKEVVERALRRRSHGSEEIFGEEVLSEEVVGQIVFAFFGPVILVPWWRIVLRRQIVQPIQPQ